MASSLFRRLLVLALAIIGITLFAVNYELAEVDASVRSQILIICLCSAALALGIAFVISYFLSRRVHRLKRIAEGLAGATSSQPPISDPGDDLASLEYSLTAVANELQGMVDTLRFESARREAILSSMAEGVLAVDPDLRITFCNRAFLRAIGFRGASFEGLSLLELVRDPELHDSIRSVLKSGESRTMRLQLSAETPRVFEVQATALPMAAGRGAIAIFHDTTELERLEQVRKDFVANVSHELRTPLAGIIGYADTLLDGALDDAEHRKRFVEIIRASAVRLGSIASDLLVLSELESGAEAAEPDLISVRGVIEAVLLTVDAEARARNVRIERETVEDVYVHGSRLRLEQAVLNLVANAIKFNRPDGEVRVSVLTNSDGQISIKVSDTGVGIPSQDLPRIFERFYRVDKARSRQVGGTGLGLSIVKHVVERMNGSVRVESQLGRGSTFILTLPAPKPAVSAVRLSNPVDLTGASRE